MKKLSSPILVTQAILPSYHTYVEKIKQIWDTHWLTNQGVLHQGLQSELKRFFDSEHVTLCVNGHLALDLAIKALRLKGEVITTPFTFVSTTHALTMNNLRPVFCDIKSTDYTIDEDKIEALIGPETSAILAVHVYGFPCEVEKLEHIAKKHNLKLIFDAAHVFGVEYNGRSIAKYGDISMFSFHATKVFNSIEGGALVYADPELEKTLDLFKNFGIADAEHITEIGLNAKMNEFQAAMGLCNLAEYEKQTKKRKQIAEIYCTRLKQISGIRLPNPSMNMTKTNFAYFPILVDETIYGITRDVLYNKLADYNIYARKYFYPLTCDCDCYNGQYKGVEVETARYTAQRILTLPIYGELDPEIATMICDIIQKNCQYTHEQYDTGVKCE
ncbi:DegT/DnrJ/EryC1/StrS family aminotransferase [uncultured Sporomusa sp.]|uniref:DegT/DnrJ/EryC1/StrS family aminotransferase n=1 Tax=uncultured Sporomusa sp. TaxID=307249 RepID=UPI0025871996|nr:DegT/DnrJ/EryC1/StrS family aminotransferase [uncultured Sporomusa sp.]